MGMASSLSWANFVTVQATFFQPNLFFSLQDDDVDGVVNIVVDGTAVTSIQNNDRSHKTTITGTCVVEMQPGQKVSDSLLFYVA